MALSTDTYWDVSGTPLQTLAYNIETWGGDIQAPPPLRGEDITIPYAPGMLIQPRRPNGRTLTLNMWVVGADVDGKVPTSATMRAEFEKNFKMLRTLFWNQGQPFQITRRWKDYGSSTVQSATATAVYVDGFAPSMNGANRATFTVELFLPDPFFYGANVNVNFGATATSNTTITVPGDFETTNISITFNAARNNFRLTNTTTGVYVNVNSNLTAGTAIMDVDAWSVQQGASNIIGKVTQYGHPFWMALKPGSQTLSLTSSSGTGSAVLTYRPRWI